MSDLSNERESENYGKIISGLLIEVVFTLLPFVIFAIVFTYENNIGDLFSESEWSVAASVLIGQTLLKIIQGGFSNKRSHTERIMLLAVLLIVFGFVPSLIVVVLILLSDPVSLPLKIIQIFLFVLALILFFVFGSVAENLKARGSNYNPRS